MELVRGRSISNPPVPRPSPPSSPKTKSSFSGLASALFKVRGQPPQKANHETFSSGPPQSHPCITEHSAKSAPYELIETWVCQDAVEPATLLRATRESLLGHAIRWGANTLMDEQSVLFIPTSHRSSSQRASCHAGGNTLYAVVGPKDCLPFITSGYLPLPNRAIIHLSLSIQISYTACTAVSKTPDPRQPVALCNAKNVSHCMTILARNPPS